MTIVTLVSGCGNAYPGEGTRGGGQDLYEDICVHLLHVLATPPLLEALAWLPHTFKI